MSLTKEIFIHELVAPGANGPVLAKVEDNKDDPESHELEGIISEIIIERRMGEYIPDQSVIGRIKVKKLGPFTLRKTQLGAVPAFDQRTLH